MEQKLAQLLRWISFSALIASTSACGTLFHSAKEIRGQVVDEETGKPLQGVIIVAQWQPYFPPSGHKGAIHSYETLTDSEGRYFIPAWGPKPVPAGAEIRNRDPALRLFKSGYAPLSRANRIDMMVHKTPPGVSDWDGKVLRMERFRGSDEEYYKLLRDRGFRNSLHPDEGEWRKFPRMIWALEKEQRRLEMALGKRMILPVTILDMSTLSNEELEFMKRYEP